MTYFETYSTIRVKAGDDNSNIVNLSYSQWITSKPLFPKGKYKISMAYSCFPVYQLTKSFKKQYAEGWIKYPVQMFQYKNSLTLLLPPLIFYWSLTAYVKPRCTGAAVAGYWAETSLCLPLTFLLHGGHLCGDAVLAGVSFNSRAAGGVSRQTRAALAAWGVQVQVITDVRLSVALFI